MPQVEEIGLGHYKPYDRLQLSHYDSWFQEKLLAQSHDHRIR